MLVSLTFLVRLAFHLTWPRIPAIALAMAYTWAASRHFTCDVKTGRTAGEALRYTIVAAAMALLNYIFYFVLTSNGVCGPVAAVTIATACQTILSFHLYRHIVFQEIPMTVESSKRDVTPPNATLTRIRHSCPVSAS
ncbi:MAG: GtrA family protein [Comamonadaceae bacterium]|uniref:GtrA family protein n=1 Tax=Candidatus Skiveiella danica TaxID=3386177 RepID=UPI00390B353A|nr:GtrA family protein [Comamonadaceae bacterium]